MNLFSLSFLARHRLKLIFAVVWLHISLLDLFFLTYRGPVFLWQENSQLLTLAVHFGIASMSTACYVLVDKLQNKLSKTSALRSNK